MVNTVNVIVKNFIPLLFFCFFWVLFSGALSFANEKTVIQPILDISYRVDSNLYRSKTSERTVSTFSLSPGLNFVHKTNKSKISAIAFFRANYYDDFSHVPATVAPSDENDYIGADAKLSAETLFFTRISAGFGARWLKTRDPYEKDSFNNATDINKYTLSRIRPWLVYQISDRLYAGLEYNNTQIDYSANIQEDSSQSGGKANLHYELTDLTKVGLEYIMWDKNYDLTTSDYTSMEYKATLSSRLKYFEFASSVGFHKREFDQAGLGDIDIITWGLSIKAQNPPQLEENERARSYLGLIYDHNFNDTGEGNEYYQADKFMLIFGHLFAEKVDASIRAFFQKSDYEQGLTDRNDETIYFSGNVDYFVNDWIMLSLNAGIESRNSSLDLYDYDNTFVLSRLTLTHDLGSK